MKQVREKKSNTVALLGCGIEKEKGSKTRDTLKTRHQICGYQGWGWEEGDWKKVER